MKELGIITIREEDNYFLGNLIEANVSEEIKINHYINFPVNYTVDTEERVLLLSGKYLEKEAKQYFPNSKIIISERTFPTKNLEEIMLIPSGEKVLIMNYPKEVADSCITELKRIGINHLNFHSYYLQPDFDHSEFNYAITFGLKEQCPKGIPNIIDVGKRAVSISTFVAIIESLQLDMLNLDNYFTTFQNMIIKGNYRIAGLLRHSEDLMRNLEYIYKNSSDGILCIDHQDKVYVINKAAEDILQLNSKQTGQSISEVLKSYPVLITTIDKEVEQDNLLLDNSLDEKIVVTISFPQVSSLAKAIVFLTRYNKIQKNERRIRHKIYKENQGLVAKHYFSDILGNSESLSKVKALAMQYSKSELNILIEGESGTGKELFAQSIHNYSNRAGEVFVACNFAALPENLIESELFGYEEGAFTGASKGGKPGLFELAHGGTIMLDEIGDASIPVQTKLLRVLEEREVMRIGSSMVTPVDVRVICATNKDLRQHIADGLFRKDLYYRIRILPLTLPGLNDRIDDIPCIVAGLAKSYNISMDLLNCILPLLRMHSWPGNVRELKSMIQYLSVILPSIEVFNEKVICDYAAEYLKNVIDQNEQNFSIISEDIPSLKEFYNYDIICFVLKCLNEVRNDNKVAGREAIRQLAKAQEIVISDSQIRTAMKTLVKFGFIKSGITRQGSVITQKGIDFLNCL